MDVCDCEHVSEPWFSLIKLGLKVVEGRLNVGKWAGLSIGDEITFFNDDFGFERRCTVKVMETRTYPSFSSYLKEEGLASTLPGVESLDEGVQIYRKYYSKSDEMKHGIIAIQLE
eukprot:m.13841 g.13841  ORF g.13841 m.13841 type:complete len:115 (-) comp7645_c0_seq1:163-507(-)